MSATLIPMHAPSKPSSNRSGSRTARERIIELFVLLKDAGVRWSDDNCLRLGASLAYYAVFSIFPLLLIAVTALGYVLGHDPETRARLLDSVTNASSPAFKTLFDSTLSDMQQHQTARGIGAIVGIVTLIVGASAVFSELEATLNQIWRVKPVATSGFWGTVLAAVRGKALSFAVVIGASVALLASLVVSSILSAVGHTVEGVATGAIVHTTLWFLVDLIGSVGVLTGVLAAMFRLIPQTKVEWRDVLGGALLTAVLFTASKRLLAWYLGHLGSYAAYGAVGGFLGLLTWIYLASLFLFYGAEFTRLYAERFGSLVGRQSDTGSTQVGEPGAHVECDAGEPERGADPEMLGETPIGGERRDHERDEAPRSRRTARQSHG
jgi:membrane protein